MPVYIRSDALGEEVDAQVGAFQDDTSHPTSGFNGLSLALHICLNPNMVKDTEADHALSLLKRIQMLANWQTTIAKASSCAFLFWNQELLATFIQVGEC